MGESSDELKQGLIVGEKKVLHDISNQLVVVQGMSGFVLKAIKKGQAVGEKEQERMEKVLTAVKNIADMVQSRRDYLDSFFEN